MTKAKWIVIPAIVVLAAIAALVVAGKWIQRDLRQSDYPDADEPIHSRVTPPTSATSGTITARLTVVDLAGLPLGGMVPIATSTANAFEPPLASGPATGADGTSYVQFSRDQYVYVRAWDSTGTYFATNYYDVPPSEEGDSTPPMRVVMARGASLGGILVDPNNNYLADVMVDAMLEHPAKGPWWPSRNTSDKTGYVFFGNVPPGQYDIAITCAAGQARIPAVELPPGATKDLGFIQLDAPQ